MKVAPTGPARVTIASDLLESLRRTNAVVVDERRRRSHFFDGRFFAARDLTREQAYFLTRQSDLGSALGVGVVWGLDVVRGSSPTSVTIAAGLGLAPGGETV